MDALRRTPLHARHAEAGARLVPFAGFEMPVQYSGIVAEHRAVRSAAGLFDVSHMGQLHLSGSGAAASLDRLVTCRTSRFALGQVRYGLLCNEEGGVVDDVTVYRSGDQSFFLCVNAANIEKDADWVRRHLAPGTDFENRSDATALLALQGPASAALLGSLSDAHPGELGRFRFAEFLVAGQQVLVSRTGYTGSDGFELYLPAAGAPSLWDVLLDAGETLGVVAVGLGARDTLRLEAALPLYGHELDDAGSPLEAGLGRFVDLDRGGFVGAEAIVRRRDAGHDRQLVGFVLDERGVARADYPIFHEGSEIGRVTSGAPSPSLGKSIGLGYVPPAFATLDTPLTIEIRGRQIAAHIVKTPFVSKGSANVG
ncbi:MAG: glycine cleavage system aminomethyltransferase GcvT [Myxococcales bacterium]|nr:glycine cleavage system aminomethyltransferase GcvT [Myxococcales bacterium]